MGKCWTVQPSRFGWHVGFNSVSFYIHGNPVAKISREKTSDKINQYTYVVTIPGSQYGVASAKPLTSLQTAKRHCMNVLFQAGVINDNRKPTRRSLPQGHFPHF